MPYPKIPLEERLRQRLVEDENGCWIWQKQKNHRYGTIKLRKGESIGAHRAAYLLWVGEIPPGMLVCHRCDVTKCCNPEHLFLGTPKQNSEDCSSKGRWRPKKGKDHYNYKHGRYSEHAPATEPNPKGPRTHCKYEHELTPENSHVYRGYVNCRQCRRDAKRRYLQKKKDDLANS